MSRTTTQRPPLMEDIPEGILAPIAEAFGVYDLEEQHLGSGSFAHVFTLDGSTVLKFTVDTEDARAAAFFHKKPHRRAVKIFDVCEIDYAELPEEIDGMPVRLFAIQAEQVEPAEQWNFSLEPLLASCKETELGLAGRIADPLFFWPLNYTEARDFYQSFVKDKNLRQYSTKVVWDYLTKDAEANPFEIMADIDNIHDFAKRVLNSRFVCDEIQNLIAPNIVYEVTNEFLRRGYRLSEYDYVILTLLHRIIELHVVLAKHGVWIIDLALRNLGIDHTGHIVVLDFGVSASKQKKSRMGSCLITGEEEEIRLERL